MVDKIDATLLDGHEVGVSRARSSVDHQVIADAAADLVRIDSKASAVLCIVQCSLSSAPEEIFKFWTNGQDQQASPSISLSGNRRLIYLPNGVCIAIELDMERTAEPTRIEEIVYQTKVGQRMVDAQKISSWEAAVHQPLLRFRSIVEICPLSGLGCSSFRRTLADFQQLQRPEIPLGELVMAGLDSQMLQTLRTFNGPKAKLPDDYMIFSAPATADLLCEAVLGKIDKMQSLLHKRADPNHVCDLNGSDDEVTPFIASVKSNSLAGAKLLLESGANPNTLCCRGLGVTAFYTASDVAKEPAMISLIRSHGGKLAAEAFTVKEQFDQSDNVFAEKLEKESYNISLDEVIAELSQELLVIRRQSPGEQRASFRRLCLKYHPDKNRGNEAFSTEVFQWLQRAALQAPRRLAGGVNWRQPGYSPASKEARPPPKIAQREIQHGPMSLEMRICARNCQIIGLGSLIEMGQTVHQKDQDGRTALFYVVRGVRSGIGDMEAVDKVADMITVLVEDYGADINFCDRAKITPLMEASRFGNKIACARLLELKADFQRKDARGRTALDIALLPASEYLTSKEIGFAADMEEHEAKTLNAIESDRAKCARFLQQGRSVSDGMKTSHKEIA